MSEHITFREGPRKAALRSSFYHPSRCEESQERGDHEPLISLRRPGSAEQAQFFSVFQLNGGKREASARASHAREEE